MKKLEGVLCNLEGTLVNTRSLILLSFRHTFERHGLAQPKIQEILDVIGLPIGACFQVLSKTHAFPNTEKFVKTYFRYKQNNPEHATLFPHTKHTLQWMKDEKIPVSLVVSQSRTATFNLLEHFGITGMFHTVITREDAQNQKPHPESLQRALEYMNVRPYRSIMLGHTPNDIIAGKAAHCRQSIAIAHAEVSTPLKRARPDQVINSTIALIPIMKRILRS
ncbi:MAG: HAD family hydrolase [Patescibacteria group bacterium]